jgi:hypothetical protein
MNFSKVVVGFEQSLATTPMPTSELRKEAWQLYELMCSSRMTQPDAYTVTTMMSICETPLELLELLQDVQERGPVELKSAVLRSAITSFGEVGDPFSTCVLFAH